MDPETPVPKAHAFPLYPVSRNCDKIKLIRWAQSFKEEETDLSWGEEEGSFTLKLLVALSVGEGVLECKQEYEAKAWKMSAHFDPGFSLLRN